MIDIFTNFIGSTDVDSALLFVASSCFSIFVFQFFVDMIKYICYSISRKR